MGCWTVGFIRLLDGDLRISQGSGICGLAWPMVAHMGPSREIIFSESFNLSHFACMLDWIGSQATCGVNPCPRDCLQTSGSSSLFKHPILRRQLGVDFYADGFSEAIRFLRLDYGLGNLPLVVYKTSLLARSCVPSLVCQFHSHKRSPIAVFSCFFED